MKKLIFTTVLIISSSLLAFGYTYNVSVQGATYLGLVNNIKTYSYTNPNMLIIKYNLSFNTSTTLYVDSIATGIPIDIGGSTASNLYANFGPFSLISDNNVHLFYLNSSQNDLNCEPFYLINESSFLKNTFCSEIKRIIKLITSSTQRWERSSNNGVNWTNLVCTSMIYTESTPTAGTYLYRALNGDGTYSAIKQVTYVDAVPSSLTVTPAINTKAVDEGITFTVSTSDPTYSYQWYKDGSTITGATSTTFSIPIMKVADAGSYTCTVSNGCNSITSAAAALAVNKAAQVLTFPDIATKTYGDAAFTLPAATDKGLTIVYQSTNTAVATVSGNTVTIVAPGTSNIIASQNGSADYLAATGVTKTLTVNKIAQVITFGALAAKTYAGAAFTLPATTDKGLTIAYTSTNTNVATVTGNTVTIMNAGTTDLIANQVGTANYYAAPTVSQTLTVNKAVQTITFGAVATKIYGDASVTLNLNTDKALPITYTSNNTAVVSVVGNVLTINKAGSAIITATQAGSSYYLAATPVPQTVTVNKADQMIVWSNMASKIYGDASFTLPATSSKGLTIAYTSADPTIASVTGNTVTIKGAGNVNITANQVGTENYNAAVAVTLPLTVTKAIQTITFADLSAYTYDNGAQTLAASSNSGLPIVYESSDYNVATLTGNTLTIGNAGQCYITASVAGNANYFTGTPVQKLLVVNKANQTVSMDIIPDKTYGDAAFTLSGSVNTLLPLTYSSSVPAKLIVSGTTATIAGAGSYTITATQAGTSNYNAATATRTFAVSKASLTATADNKTRVYGDANPAFTVSYSGFVNGDSKYELASLPVASTTAIITSNVGDYSVSLSTLTDLNYSLVYRSGLMSITQAPLMVTAQAATKTYGDANPTFTLNYSGFKNSQTSTVLTALPAASTVAKTMSNVGMYDIVVSGGSATNYALSYTNGQLTVGKAMLKVYAIDATRVYGDANPTFTLNVTGYKGSDNVTILTALPVVNCAAITTSIVGAYNVTYAGASADNYLFDYATTVGKLTVTKAALMVTADNLTKEYGNANPTLTYSFAGFKNSETSSVLSVQPTISTTALVASNVGAYDIVASSGSASNYALSYTGAKITITKAPLTVSGVNATKIYGNANPTLTVSYSGFKNSQTSTALTTVSTASTTAITTSNAGDYDIAAAGGTSVNYSFAYTNGKLSITKAPLNISAKNDSITKGAAIPSFVLAYSGFKGSDDFSILDVLPSISCSASSASAIGKYDIVVQGGSDKNYNYTLKNGVFVIKDNTGIQDVNSYNTRLYPIPADNKIFIKSNLVISKVEVYAVNGQLMNIQTGTDMKIMDVSGLIKGSYMMRLYSNQTIVTRKIVKK